MKRSETREQALNLAIKIIRELDRSKVYFSLHQQMYSPMRVFVGEDRMKEALEAIKFLSAAYEIEHDDCNLIIHFGK